MKDRKRKPTGLPDIFDDDDDIPLPEPPAWDREPGAPEPIDPEKESISKTGIIVLDEKAFMEEAAGRINAFIATYPKEAQHVLRTWIGLEHELVPIFEAELPPGDGPAPRMTVAALLGALLQTHHGTGYVLRPVMIPDPDNPGHTRIAKFVVDQQEDLEDPQS